MDLKMGDPVEVKFHMKKGYGTREMWVPATVCSVGQAKIGVAYSDGTREMVSESSGRLRKPQRK